MILAILQARASSRRLPGKVLKPILGRPMLARQIERIGRARRIDRLLVATSLDPSDDPVAALCGEVAAECFRGSLEDVLDRFYRAVCTLDPTSIVRLTGDCPLTDPAIIDRLIELHVEAGHDYTSNTLTRTFPDGLDAEVMRFACLEKAWREAVLPSEREHVTPYIYHHPELFRLGNLAQDGDRSHLRWTVDEPADFAFVCRVYEELYPSNPAFDSNDVLQLLARRPDIAGLMRQGAIDEGYRRSLAADAAYLAGRTERK